MKKNALRNNLQQLFYYEFAEELKYEILDNIIKLFSK